MRTMSQKICLSITGLIFIYKYTAIISSECLWRSRLLCRSHLTFQLLKRSQHNSCTATTKFDQSLVDRLAAIQEAGTWKEERIITSKQGPEINVQGSQNKILNFCANNYLGLSVSETDC
jgi:hypothetical protein